MNRYTPKVPLAYPPRAWTKALLLASILAALFLAGRIPTQAGDGSSPTHSATADTPAPYLFKDLVPGEDGSSPSGLIVVNDLGFFRADSLLWKSDGTPEGTIPSANFSFHALYHPSLMGEVNGSLIVFAQDWEYGTYYHLWKTDGTSEGTVQIHNLLDQYNDGSYLRGSQIVDDILYLFLEEGNYLQLWTSDGTPEGTSEVVSIPANCTLPHVDRFTTLNNRLYFLIQSGYGDCNQLWVTDGTEEGTTLVKSFQLYSETMMVFYDRIFISANDGDGAGLELWVSDGTPEGTTLFKDLNPGSADSMPSFVGVIGDTLYLGAKDPTIGHELWASDGTPDGTQIFMDLRPGNLGSYPGRVADFGTYLIFAAVDDTYFKKLWRSDGTVAGTYLLGEEYPIESMYYRQIVKTLYFCGGDNDHGYEFWQSNGTIDGTFMIADINPGTPGSDPRYFTQYDGKIFFTADDGTHGDELWVLELPEDGHSLYLPLVEK
jgi:ELWxxDGT repeat protein